MCEMAVTRSQMLVQAPLLSSSSTQPVRPKQQASWRAVVPAWVGGVNVEFVESLDYAIQCIY